MTERDPERTAWDAARVGDGEAFGVLFDRHCDRVFRHARRLTASTADAEDVVAAAFFELWRRRRSVRVVDGSVLPWLLVTATNISRNLTRGLRRYRTMLASLPRSPDALGADEVTVDLLQQEEAVVLARAALKVLKPKDAILVTLTVIENFSPSEAASALGISPGSARTRLHRARAQMAKEIGSRPDGIWQDLDWEGAS